MFQRFMPIVNVVRRRVGFGKDLSGAAKKITVLQPEELEPSPAVHYLPNQPGKVTGSTPYTPLDIELKNLTSETMTHAPVIRHTLQNCMVHSAGVEFQGGSYRRARLSARSLVLRPDASIPRALYSMSAVCDRFFGHWLTDACSTALLRDESEALLLDLRQNWPHCQEYAQALKLNPQLSSTLYVDELTIIQDYSQGSSKRARYAEMRRRLRSAFPSQSRGSQLIYLRRGSTGAARNLINEEEVISSLATRGFEVFDLAGASVRDIMLRFRDAKTVVSVSGSHLSHLYFTMPPGANLLTLNMANCFTMVHRGYCAAVGLRFGFIVIDPVSNGFMVSLPDLHATLDLMSS